MTKRKPITAAEHLAILSADPEWVAMRAAKDAELAKRRAQLRVEAKPLLDDLAALGIAVESAWELNSGYANYEAAIPVLLSHLKRPYSPRISEGIARALAFKEARLTAWEPLLKILRTKSFSGRVADGVMAAISEMARPADIQTLIELMEDNSLGSQRMLLVSNLMRSKKPEARSALLRLQNDPELQKEITFRLKKSRTR